MREAVGKAAFVKGCEKWMLRPGFPLQVIGRMYVGTRPSLSYIYIYIYIMYKPFRGGILLRVGFQKGGRPK